jgi:hypothetical protein
MKLFTFFKRLITPREPGAPPQLAQAPARPSSGRRIASDVYIQELTEQSLSIELRNAELLAQLAAFHSLHVELKGQLSSSLTHNQALSDQLMAAQDQLGTALTRSQGLEAHLQTALTCKQNIETQLQAARTQNQELSDQLEGYRAREARPIPGLPPLSDAERTPSVLKLLEIVQRFKEQVQTLRDEIARLKGLKPKLKLLPSRLNRKDPPPGPQPENSASSTEPPEGASPEGAPPEGEPAEGTEPAGEAPREGGNCGDKPPKRKKKPHRHLGNYRQKELEIHKVIPVPPENIPPGSKYKGYEDFTVRGVIFQPYNVIYRRERWETPEGDTLIGPLPPELGGKHFTPNLQALVLYLHHHGRMTQPLIHEMLMDYDFDISSGKVNDILTNDKDLFHQEKEDILAAGLEVSRYIHVDDTGARHGGRNGYCTHIGNELFAYFKSTKSKSRLNFLEILRLRYKDYVLNDEALSYMKAHHLPSVVREKLNTAKEQVFETIEAWNVFLQEQGISKAKHIQLATEGALIGSLHQHSDVLDIVIISDGARQFVFTKHGLCWVHAERLLNKLVGVDDAQKAAVEKVRGEIWECYWRLKEYKKAPSQEKKEAILACFEEIFGQKTCFIALNDALQRLRLRKKELLIVLEHPELPLENNLSERDIREYVSRRKISGSTRSEAGRECRDTFASLKKTNRKLGISFREYLVDRLSQRHAIPSLGDLIRQRGHGKGRVPLAEERAAA